ncbi:hypothetical protein RND71_018368 [Anisodus tanguticus]|uniref:Uncharacterized protein n=1 Tax=Anisodus tanguticus TaxID=243964 RepID=A0AAE1VC14_9SOLA|nr:hypothetical protein RND71_018368 [Anisodus tanguticus]
MVGEASDAFKSVISKREESAIRANLVLLEALSTFKPINLPAIMIDHIIKVATMGTKKHMFTMTTLEKCESKPKKGGAGSNSVISTPIETQEIATTKIQKLKAENALLRVQLEEKAQ